MIKLLSYRLIKYYLKIMSFRYNTTELSIFIVKYKS